ncbi:hypothetical protein EB74_28095 [Mycobacterium sp. SWH-M5]|nr:hypothetical protein EB74_28095 [Mycobacterium sp. SWH-M5]
MGSSSHPHTATETAAPEAKAASEADIHAAVDETCAAAETFRTAVGAVRQPYTDAARANPDWNSPEFVSIEGRYFGGVAAELWYLSDRINPAAPRSITDAVKELHKAATALFDADVRREPGDVASRALAQLRSADSAVKGACEEAGAAK